MYSTRTVRPRRRGATLLLTMVMTLTLLVSTGPDAGALEVRSTVAPSEVVTFNEYRAEDLALSCARDLRTNVSYFWDYYSGMQAAALIYGNAGACGPSVSRLDTRAWVQLTCLTDPLNPRRSFDSSFAAGTGGSVASAHVGPYNSITCPPGSTVSFQVEVVVTLHNGQQPRLCIQHNGVVGGPINELSRSTAGCPGF